MANVNAPLLYGNVNVGQEIGDDSGYLLLGHAEPNNFVVGADLVADYRTAGGLRGYDFEPVSSVWCFSTLLCTSITYASAAAHVQCINQHGCRIFNRRAHVFLQVDVA